MVTFAPKNEGSPSGSFDWQTDGKKLLKGALIAAIGAILTYLEDALPGIDFGPTWTPVAVGLNSVLVNFFRKWLGHTSQIVQLKRPRV